MTARCSAEAQPSTMPVYASICWRKFPFCQLESALFLQKLTRCRDDEPKHRDKNLMEFRAIFIIKTFFGLVFSTSLFLHQPFATRRLYRQLSRLAHKSPASAPHITVFTAIMATNPVSNPLRTFKALNALLFNPYIIKHINLFFRKKIIMGSFLIY